MGKARHSKEATAAMARRLHPANGRPFKPAYDESMGMRCGATTVRNPDASDWSPELPETVVPATCSLNGHHRGWHVSRDGYSWNPEDDAEYVVFPTPSITH